MLREPLLDAPSVLQHVVTFSIEQRLLFRHDHDRNDFLRLIAVLMD